MDRKMLIAEGKIGQLKSKVYFMTLICLSETFIMMLKMILRRLLQLIIIITITPD